MEIAKALILAGPGADDGRWTRTRGSSAALFPIANRPILFHGLEALREAGVLEAAIVCGGATGEAIRDAVGDGRRWQLSVRHLDGEAGVGAALAATRGFVGDEPVFVLQGSALLREHLHPHIAAFAREQLDVLELRLAGWTPAHLLSPEAVTILARGGAADPTDAVRVGGGRVRVQPVDGCLPRHGDGDSLLDANRCMLERLVSSAAPATLEDCTVQGPVEIHPTARVARTLLRGPVVIGPGARVCDAYVGPYTSIGAGVVIEGAQIEHSIVLPEAELRFVGTRLESSIIGRGARIVRGFHLPDAIRVSLGDGAEVVLR